MSRNRDSGLRNRSGFTLIEVIVVIVVIATLASIVGPAVFGNIGDAKSAAARSQVEILALALESYRLHNGVYPENDQGLDALRTMPSTGTPPSNWRGPYLRRSVPLDPWNRPYQYRNPGLHDTESFEVYTLGRDGTPGGEGEDADVTSWGGPVDS